MTRQARNEVRALRSDSTPQPPVPRDRRRTRAAQSVLLAWVLNLFLAGLAGETTPSAKHDLAFHQSEGGAYVFDTGVLRGVLRREGKSLGVSSLTHLKTGVALDRSNGLFSHYRVFTKGARYGGGAWDWPSAATLRPDGAVEVRWPATDGRPFEMTARYRWSSADSLDLETSVLAKADLSGFESFLASYFDPSFTNVLVCAGAPNRPFIPARKADGDWQMFPRDEAVIPLIHDGRWKLEPNPVNWTLRPTLIHPLALRRAPGCGLTVLLMGATTDCFAIATPHEAEGHYSVYLSLFGRDLKPGETATALTRLTVLSQDGESSALERYRAFQK